MSRVHDLAVRQWAPTVGGSAQALCIEMLERGNVVLLPQLGFDLSSDERRFLDPSWSAPNAKNISYDPATGRIRGAQGDAEALQALQSMVERFHRQALGLIERLFPRYASALSRARTSFRPQPVADRQISWRKDDRRLHVDAFPSRPVHGQRILRVFSNVNAGGLPRTWRVGEPFEALAKRFLPRLRAPVPGSALVLAVLRITKSRRSRYDHYMLQLHDCMKADAGYQRDAPQEVVDFAPGSTWICFSDQVAHAAVSGQYLLEQTAHLPVDAMYHPQHSPLRVLERLMRQSLI